MCIPGTWRCSSSRSFQRQLATGRGRQRLPGLLEPRGRPFALLMSARRSSIPGWPGEIPQVLRTGPHSKRRTFETFPLRSTRSWNGSAGSFLRTEKRHRHVMPPVVSRVTPCAARACCDGTHAMGSNALVARLLSTRYLEYGTPSFHFHTFNTVYSSPGLPTVCFFLSRKLSFIFMPDPVRKNVYSFPSAVIPPTK